jgi:hypothetical protein
MDGEIVAEYEDGKRMLEDFFLPCLSADYSYNLNTPS